MKAKKNLTIVTFLCTIASLISAFLIGKESNCIYYDFSMAIFGSALLGFIMSLIEYFVVRRDSMERFWLEAHNVLSDLRKIKYIDIDAPIDMVHACFLEEWSNNLRRYKDPNIKTKAKNELIGWYEQNIPMIWDEFDDINAELDKYYDEQMQLYKHEYMQCINSYIEASKIDLDVLSNACGDLDFIFDCANAKEIAYKNIYVKIKNLKNELLSECPHFKRLNENRGNFPVCAGKADRICQIVFDIQFESVSGIKEMVVYQRLLDDIDVALEDFRLKIYKNAPENYPERIPVLGRMPAIEWSEQLGNEKV